MNLLLLALIAVFVIVNVGVEFLRKDLNPRTDPMSSYLTGQYGQVVDLSYFALAAAIAMLPLYLGASLVFAVICWIAAVAVLVVVFTKRWIAIAPSEQMKSDLERWHVAGAGIAFAGAWLAIAIHGHHDQFQFLVAIASAAWIMARIHSNATAITEKVFASLVVLGLVLIVLVPKVPLVLHGIVKWVHP